MSDTSPDQPPVQPSVQPSEQPPLLRVVKGDPTPEEVAALVAVVSMLSVGEADTRPQPRPEWGAHHRKLRTPLRHGPGAWRAGVR